MSDKYPYPHKHIPLPRGGWATVDPNCSKETIDALMALAEKVYHYVPPTDWDKELDLLSEYMDYYIEFKWNYQFLSKKVLNTFKQTGYLICIPHYEILPVMTFEQWKQQSSV